MFLNTSELTDLTGLKLPAYQRRWLIKNGYSFDVDNNGRPRVLRKYVERRLGYVEHESATTVQPNYDAIKHRKRK